MLEKQSVIDPKEKEKLIEDYREIIRSITEKTQKKNSVVDFSKYKHLHKRLTANMYAVYAELLNQYTNELYREQVKDNKVFKKISHTQIAGKLRKDRSDVSKCFAALANVGLIERGITDSDENPRVKNPHINVFVDEVVFEYERAQKRYNGGCQWIHIPELT